MTDIEGGGQPTAGEAQAPVTAPAPEAAAPEETAAPAAEAAAAAEEAAAPVEAPPAEQGGEVQADPNSGET